MTCGVYKITCLTNNRFYIGSAQDCEYRWRKHKECLNRRKHQNIYLQRAWDKYGKDAFCFEIVQEVCVNDLIQQEQNWLDMTKCYDPSIGFNICQYAYSSRGRPPGIKCIEVISKCWILTNPSGDEITVNNLSRFCRENNLSRDCLKNVSRGETDSWKGWKCRLATMSMDEWLELRNKRRMKYGHFRKWLVTSPDGEEYVLIGLNKFCKQYGLISSDMHCVAKGKALSHRGWKCQYA